jgi:hypothetical protein
MIIRAGFGDNDFCIPIQDACEAVLADISRGYSGEKLIEKFKAHLDVYGIEDIRRRIVISATGFCLARDGARGRVDSFEIAQPAMIFGAYHNTLNYLNKNIEAAVVECYDKDDDDNGACYIDLYRNLVVLC